VRGGEMKESYIDSFIIWKFWEITHFKHVNSRGNMCIAYCLKKSGGGGGLGVGVREGRLNFDLDFEAKDLLRVSKRSHYQTKFI